jgi:hypothetical protein
MKTANSEKHVSASGFLSSGTEVTTYIYNYLRTVVEDYKPYECENINAGPKGRKYVLGGTVGFKESTSFSDLYRQRCSEGYFMLGHATIGPQPALRAVASIRKELIRALRLALPRNSVIEHTSTSFSAVLRDGSVTITSMSSIGFSVVRVTASLGAK